MGTGVVAENPFHAAITQRRDQAQDVPHQVEHAERRKVTVIVDVPAGGASIAPLVGCNDVIARRRDGQHYFAPAIGQFREAVQQQDQRAVFRFVSRFEDVHPQAVVVIDEPRADPGGQDVVWQRKKLDHRGLTVGVRTLPKKSTCMLC